MENIQHIADTIKEFASNPTVASGINFASSALGFIGDYVGLIIVAAVGLGVLQWRKKFKAAESLAKTGFRGMIVTKAFVDKKKNTIRVMGININGLDQGDTVAFDKDPFQTKCMIRSRNMMAEGEVTRSSFLSGFSGVKPESFTMNSSSGSSSVSIQSTSLVGLFNLIKKGIQASKVAKQTGEPVNIPGITINSGAVAETAKSNASVAPMQDITASFSVKPAPVSNDMITLEFSNPTEFARIMESQAIGQGNRKVLKAKDLKLVLREKAKKPAAVIPEIVRNK